MKPIEICANVLGPDKVEAIVGELSSPQIKAVLKEGGIKVKLPSGFVSQTKKRKAWSTRILGALDDSNHDTADELLRQWLLHHRRELLMSYLDMLEVRHTDGETDESFLLSQSSDRIQDAASALISRYDGVEARAYLEYIAYQQRSSVFEEWEPIRVESSAGE